MLKKIAVFALALVFCSLFGGCSMTGLRKYTLSDEGQKIAEHLTMSVSITVFEAESTFKSPHIDNSINKILQQFYQATKQYNSLSDGKVQTSYVNMMNNSAAANGYSKYNVSEDDILFQCGDKFHKASVEDLLSYDTSTYRSTSEIKDATSYVEQILASGITMVSGDITPKIALLTGHNEDSSTKSDLSDLLSKNNYMVEDQDITSISTIDDDFLMAVISAPTEDYTANDISKLRSWLNNGGKLGRQLLVMANYQALCPNLYQFLNTEYGIEVTDKLVYETSSSRIYNNSNYYPYGDIAFTDFTADISEGKDLMPACRQLLTNNKTDTENSLVHVNVVTFPNTAKLISLSAAMNSNTSTGITPFSASGYPIIGLEYATKKSSDRDGNLLSTHVLVSGSNMMLSSGALSMSSLDNGKTIVSLINGFTGNQNTVNVPGQPVDKIKMKSDTDMMSVYCLIIFVAENISALLTAGIVILLRRRNRAR